MFAFEVLDATEKAFAVSLLLLQQNQDLFQKLNEGKIVKYEVDCEEDGAKDQSPS